MRAALLTVALLALAACGREEAPAPAPVEPAPIPSKPPLVRPPEAPGRLAFVDAGGVERLSITCDGGQMQVTVPGFERIGSEDRLTLGAGDEAFAFVADLEAPGPGVTASGRAEADLFARMARGEPVGAVYGAQRVGPARAETPAALQAFVSQCGGVRQD